MFSPNKQIQSYIRHFSSLETFPKDYYKQHHHFNLTIKEKELAKEIYLATITLCKKKDNDKLRKMASQYLNTNNTSHSLYQILNSDLYDFLMLLAE
jgi:hypothetical protein